MITCNDCKYCYMDYEYYKPIFTDTFCTFETLCVHPKAIEIDPILGIKSPSYAKNFRDEFCGWDEMRYFKPKLIFRLSRKLNLR